MIFNPRVELENYMRDNQHASEREVRDAIWAKFVSENDFALLFDYWFANNYRSIAILRPSAHETVVKRQARTIRRPLVAPRKKAEEVKQMIAAVVLMELKLSNGKLLKDATGAEVARESGWLREIAKHMKPTQVVGKRFKEVDLRNLLMRNAA